MDKEFLKSLLATNSPDGSEKGEATELFSKYCSNFAKYEFSDVMFNTAFSVGNGTIPFMISGHIDEIGMTVQYIDDDGFIYFIANGGIDKEVLLGATVQILTSKGVVRGVIGKVPIHLTHRSKDKAELKLSDLKIDCGFESKEEALENVSVGDNIVMQDIPLELGKNRFCGKGLDDKVGVFVVTQVLRELSKHKLKNLKVYGVALTQEETGGGGAVIGTKHINPTYSIDYDVHFASDDGNVPPKEWGDIKLGQGGAIAYSPDCHRRLANFIKETCEETSTPYQVFAKPNGMTNTMKIRNNTSGAMTTLLSIPLRNMHTQVEVCDYRDLESLINMTVETILRIDANGIYEG